MYPKKLQFPIYNLKIGAEFYLLKYWNAQHVCETFRTVSNVKNKLEYYLKTNGVTKYLFHEKFAVFPSPIRLRKNAVPDSLWTRECLLAQKLRKAHQMFNITKLWEEKKLKNFISRMKLGGGGGGKRKAGGGAAGEVMMLSSATLLAAFDWDKFRIPEKEMKSHINDLNYVYTLRDKTICQGCKPSENTGNICHCDDFKSPEVPLKYDNWETFIEKKDLVVWRRLLETGHYEYKVYGSYNDVSAEEFLNVQVDTNYRRMWDTTAITLEVVETDPEPKNNTDVIYWEMLWPMLFANRDYVFIRRYLVDYNTKSIIMANKSIAHQRYPERSDKFRVKDYWSYMVVRPHTELDKHGIEFVLTYYDNPGVSIPSKVTTWVAMRAMPDFLERLREAAKKYKAYCKQYGVKCIYLLKDGTTVGDEQTDEFLYYFLDSEEDLVTDNTISEAQHNLKVRNYKKQDEPPKASDSGNKEKIKATSSPSASPTTTPILQRGTKNVWKYLQPSYYIS